LDNYVEFESHNNLTELIDGILKIDDKFKKDGIEVYKLKENLIPLVNNRISIVNYKNYFFKLINVNSIKNWVDIENLYYDNLKERAKGELQHKNYCWAIKQLNRDFEEIKILFEKYLKEKVINKFNFDSFGRDDFTKFYNIFFPSLLDHKFIRLNEIFSDDDRKYIDKLIKDGKEKDLKLYFLCFNYTPTLLKYCSSLKNANINIYLNFIHGEIDNKDENKINFGFGDEMDEDYKLIENINNNEYLKFFKSFQYLQNSNYKNLLDFIDNDKFEVLIMGHACGLSDRTLLNTVFEHINCSLIRVFYYQWEDKHTKELNDNYIELTQNISRHFDDKKIMRKRIANKIYCEPMPNNVLPIKDKY
jgi:hypothetical protein